VQSHDWVPSEPHRRIIVADEDRKAVDQILSSLREDGHTVFPAYDVLSAGQLAQELVSCDLLIGNATVQGINCSRQFGTCSTKPASE
jgi:hypothetical protein